MPHHQKSSPVPTAATSVLKTDKQLKRSFLRRKQKTINHLRDLCLYGKAEALLLLVSKEGRVYSFCSDPLQNLLSHVSDHQLVERCMSGRGQILVKDLLLEQNDQADSTTNKSSSVLPLSLEEEATQASDASIEI